MKSFMSRQGLVFLLLLATATTICESHEPNAEAEDFHLSDFSEENELDEAPSQWGPYVNQNEDDETDLNSDERQPSLPMKFDEDRNVDDDFAQSRGPGSAEIPSDAVASYEEDSQNDEENGNKASSLDKEEDEDVIKRAAWGRRGGGWRSSRRSSWGSRRRSSWGGSRRRSSWRSARRRRSSWRAARRRRSSWRAARRRSSWRAARRRSSWRAARRRSSWRAARRRSSWRAARRRSSLRSTRRRSSWRAARRRSSVTRRRRSSWRNTRRRSSATRRRRSWRATRRRSVSRRRSISRRRTTRRRRTSRRRTTRRRRTVRRRRTTRRKTARRRRITRRRISRRRAIRRRRRFTRRRSAFGRRRTTRRRRRSFWRRARMRRTAQKTKKKVRGWFGKLWKGIKKMIGKSKFRIRVAAGGGGEGGGGEGGGGSGGGGSGGGGSGGGGSGGGGGGGQPNQPKCDQQCKAQIRKALNAIKTLKQSYCAFYVASQNQTDFLVNRDENNASSLLQKYASDSFSMYESEVATVKAIDSTVNFESKVALNSDCMKVNGKNLPCSQGKHKTVKQFHDLKCFQACMGDVDKCKTSDEKLSTLIEGAVKAFNDKIIKVAG